MILLWLLASAPAAAAPACRIPAVLPRAIVTRPGPDEARRIMPIGGYTLALIWLPQQCRRAVPGAQTLACARGQDDRRFVLHGLWPDGEGSAWPQWCRDAAVLSAMEVRANWCATPSSQLLQHEWAKHGTCIPGATPSSYFADAGRLFDRVRAPDMVGLSRTTLSKGALAEAVAAANPGLRADAVRVRTDRRGWLQEVWLCLDRRRAFTRCREQDAGGDRVLIWRGGR